MSEQTATQIDTTQLQQEFSQRELQSLWLLRAEYPVRRDHIGARELRHLRFIRWLYQTGRVTP
jgi:hypothetical protein